MSSRIFQSDEPITPKKVAEERQPTYCDVEGCMAWCGSKIGYKRSHADVSILVDGMRVNRCAKHYLDDMARLGKSSWYAPLMGLASPQFVEAVNEHWEKGDGHE